MTDGQRLAWDVIADDGLDHAEATAAFLTGFCPPQADPVWSKDYMAWKLGAANPAGPGFCTIALHDGRVVGCASIARKRLWLGDRMATGGELGDCYSDAALHRHGFARPPYPGEPSEKAYLNRSIFGRLVTETRARAEAAGLGLIYGTPNANAMPGYRKRLGFPEHETHRTENYLRPTVSGFGERVPAIKPLAPLLVPLDRAAAAGVDALRHLLTPGLTVGPFEGTDIEIDELWDRAKRDLPFSLVRDSRWFRYRFAEHPLNRYEMLAVRRGAALRALVVTRRFVTMRGRPYLYVADWLFERGEGAAFGRALGTLLRHTAPLEIDGVLLWAERHSEAAAIARHTGFLARGKSPLIFADTPDARAFTERVPQLEFSLAFSDNV